MQRTGWLGLMLAAWGLVLVGTTVAVAMIAPTGDGFTRGMNRAGLLAVGIVLLCLLALGASRAARGLTGQLARAGRSLPWVTLACCATALAWRLLVLRAG